jgi:hypothetical protein
MSKFNTKYELCISSKFAKYKTAPLSFSDITAEQALERVQELMKENQNLRGIDYKIKCPLI